MIIGFLKPESTNKAIIFSMSMSLVAKVLTFIQSLAISYAFGAQKSTDILFYGVSLVLLLTSIVSSINQQVIVPNVISIRNTRSEEESGSLISFIYFIYLIVGILGSVVLFVFPAKVLSLLSRFTTGDIEANIVTIRFIIPTFIFILINTYILDILASYRYFTLPMFLDMAKNLIIIACIMLLKGRFSVTSLAIGIFCGNALQFIVLNFMMLKMLNWRLSVKYYPVENNVRKNILYVIMGQLMAFIHGFITMYLLSGFDSGVFTAMDYGQKITVVIISVVIGQISTVVGMNIIELHSIGDYRSLNTVFLNYLKKSMLLVLPGCLILALNSHSVIYVLFQRGRFTEEDVRITAGFFLLFTLAIPLRLVDTFVVRLIIAKQIQRISFLWQIFYNALSVPMIFLLVYSVGYYGYPLGELVASTLYITLQFRFLLKKQFTYIDTSLLAKFLMVVLAINLAASGAVLLILKNIRFEWTLFNNILIPAVTFTLYTIVVVPACCLFKCTREPVADLLGHLADFLRRKIQITKEC